MSFAKDVGNVSRREMCLWRDVSDVKGETSWVREAYACVWEREKGERKGTHKKSERCF